MVDIEFGNARSDRSTNTISYEINIRNDSDLPLILPVLLTLDPAAGYAGLPAGNDGKRMTASGSSTYQHLYRTTDDSSQGKVRQVGRFRL